MLAANPEDARRSRRSRWRRLKLANWRGSTDRKGPRPACFGCRETAACCRPTRTPGVITGALEQSNVNPSEVLVEMVEAQRLFDMRTKLVATAADLDEAGAGLMRINS